MSFDKPAVVERALIEPAHTVRLPVARGPLLLSVTLLVAFGVVPLVGSDYLFSAILIPFLVLSLAGLGLNLLTGYAGQLSLGSAAFMAVGAFAAYNFMLRVPGMPLLAAVVLGGLCAAGVGVVFGLPSLRIKGFYLIVSTLAAQFFVQWLLTKVSWFSNDSASGVISAPRLMVLGRDLSSPAGRYVLTLAIVCVLSGFAYNIVHSQTGRRFVAVRDMDMAAALLGIPILRTKLLAFAVSSFYIGVAGVLWAFAYLGTVEPHGFDLTRSYQILFIVIIGGLGSLPGAFLGSAFIVLVPVGMSLLSDLVFAGSVDSGQLENLQKMLFGGLLIGLLIKEPEGLARLLARPERARAC